MTKHACILIFIVLTFSQCRKKEEEKPLTNQGIPVYHYYNSNLSGMKFKPGSYYIYQKNSQPVYDTVYITYAGETTCEYLPCSTHGVAHDTCHYYINYSMTYLSKYNNTEYSYALHQNRFAMKYGNWCNYRPIYCANTTFQSTGFQTLRLYPQFTVQTNIFQNV